MPCDRDIFSGPSPRVRGSRLGCRCGCRGRGSIPACAGKPRCQFPAETFSTVHPRVCGEAPVGQVDSRRHGGPSPRVRGSPAAGWCTVRRPRSIPACAGKPDDGRADWFLPRVHPRVCGEARRGLRNFPVGEGPSPRVRGSPRRVGAVGPGRRSIPACAGKPERLVLRLKLPKVHPRVCGEAPSVPVDASADRGPSPRVRGSLASRASVAALQGSIPACAGKPASCRAVSAVSRVHPRVCGEAKGNPTISNGARGPSPRVRGSRAGNGSPSTALRSIPACAGKPGQGQGQGQGAVGPSPRVRGSHHRGAGRSPARGSIPACAGKPPVDRRAYDASRVHPRVCGEALTPAILAARDMGPSPRVRGSPGRPAEANRRPRSIPACAGKPLSDY